MLVLGLFLLLSLVLCVCVCVFKTIFNYEKTKQFFFSIDKFYYRKGKKNINKNVLSFFKKEKNNNKPKTSIKKESKEEKKGKKTNTR